MSNEKQKTIFLDRDGTLNEDVDYLSRIEDLQIFPFTLRALQLLKAKGYLIIVVTNQSGIGRGLYDEVALKTIHQTMQEQLDHLIDAFYHCPHLPKAGCRCRKPGLGMIEQAQKDFEIDLRNSWVAGDKELDIQTGFAAGTRTAMVRTGYGSYHEHRLDTKPDVIAENILEAAKNIISRTPE
jgi:D-glycero-D-manno-heptose 1,7-bisphosphate phosphatase